MRLSRNRAFFWLAIITLLWQGMLPLRHLGMASGAQGVAMLDVCSVSGKVSLPLPLGKSAPSGQTADDHCPCCGGLTSNAPPSALPNAPILVAAEPADLPALATAPREVARRHLAEPRAPPRFLI